MVGRDGGIAIQHELNNNLEDMIFISSSLLVALAVNKPLVLPGVNKNTLVYAIKTSVLQWCWFGDCITQK